MENDEIPQPMTGALERSLAALAVGFQEEREDVRTEEAPLMGTDMVQAIHLPISGKVGGKLIWVEKNVLFPNPFFNNVDPSVSDGTLETPHYGGCGVELLSDLHVMIDAYVREWLTDWQTGWVSGARMRISVWTPAVFSVTQKHIKKHPYNAILHLTFTGWGAPADDDDEEA